MKRPALLLLLCACTTAMAQTPQDSATTYLSQVTVNGQQQRVTYRLDRQRISADAMLTASGGTALDILRAVPSVTIDADGNLSYRGSQQFLVYVDGKPSPLSGTEALQMVTASTIKDIEILTTPSARYKTEGEVGIINIITRKAETDGLDAVVNLTGSTWGSLGADAMLNYRTGHHNIYIAGQASDLHNKSDFEQEKHTEAAGTRVFSRADGTRFRDFRTFIGRGGYEFSSPSHNLQLELQGGRTINPRGGDMTYREQRWLGEVPSSDNLYDSHDRYKLTKYLYQASGAYTWKVNERGDELHAETRFRYDSWSEEYTESNLFLMSDGSRHEGTRGYETEHHWDCDGALSYKLKYSSTGQLEAGYQYTTYSEHGDYKILYWDIPQQQFVNQEDLYAPFYYRRQVHSGYAQMKDRFGRFALDAGLRADHLVDDMDLPTITSRHRRYTDLFPSAHLGYYTEQAGTFTLGYSMRTNRPGIWKLEPYITYEDYYTRIIGNPDLKSEYIHAMELNWRKELAHDVTLSATAYARRRTQVVDYIRRAYDAGITLDSIINAGDQWDVGLEAQMGARMTRWWNVNLQGYVSHYDFDATYEGCTDANGWTGQVGWINNFALTKHLALQFDGHYVAPTHLTQGRESAYVYFDLAARWRLLRDRLCLGLTAHDVFHTARYHNLRTNANLTSETWVRPQYPNVMLTVAYHFRQPVSKHKGNAINEKAEFTGSDF